MKHAKTLTQLLEEAARHRDKAYTRQGWVALGGIGLLVLIVIVLVTVACTT